MRSNNESTGKSGNRARATILLAATLGSAGGLFAAAKTSDTNPSFKFSNNCKADIAQQKSALEAHQVKGDAFEAEIFTVGHGPLNKTPSDGGFGEVVISDKNKHGNNNIVMIDPIIMRCGSKIVEYAGAASETAVTLINATSDNNQPELLGRGNLHTTENVTLHYVSHGFVDQDNRRYAIDPNAPMIQSEPGVG